MIMIIMVLDLWNMQHFILVCSEWFVFSITKQILQKKFMDIIS